MEDPRWDRFEAFCEGHDEEPLPAEADTVARFARELGEAGEPLDEVVGALQSVSARHRVVGQPDPTDDDPVHEALDELAQLVAGSSRSGASSDALDVEVLPADDELDLEKTSSVRGTPGSEGQMRGYLGSETGVTSSPALTEAASGLPPILAGHATPVLQEATARFYASVEAPIPLARFLAYVRSRNCFRDSQPS